MKYGSDLITIDQVLASVKMDAGITDTSIYDLSIEKWINDAVFHTNANSLYVKRPMIVELKAGENEICLPSGFKKLFGIRSVDAVLDEDGNIESTTCSPILIADRRFLSDCGCDNLSDVQDLITVATITDGKIVFNKPAERDTKLQISYLGINVDDDCVAIIPAYMERGVSAYARARFYGAYPEVKGMQYSLIQQDKSFAEWVAQKKWIKGVAARDSFNNDKYEISRIVKAWFARRNDY
jgi:hypothetical protein